METLIPNTFSDKYQFLSSYLQDLLLKTSEFCSIFQRSHKHFQRLEKKLGIYEKFQGLNRLSQPDLERLERHFNKGLNEIKEERIKRKYQAKIIDLQTRLGEKPEENEKSRESMKKKEEIEEKYEELIMLLKEHEKLEMGTVNLKEALFFIKEEESILRTYDEKTTPKKTRQFSLGCPFDETVKDLNNSNMNENVLTKVSSFGEDNIKNIENSMNPHIEKEKGESFIMEMLNSTNLERKSMKNSKHGDLMEEQSPDFSFKSHNNNKPVNRKVEAKEGNFSVDLTNIMRKDRKFNRNASISGTPLGKSINFSFHFNEEEEKNNIEKMGEVMLLSARDGPKENLYLMKLSKELKKK